MSRCVFKLINDVQWHFEVTTRNISIFFLTQYFTTLVVLGRYQSVTVGLGDNVWAIRTDRKLYQKKAITTLSPLGLSWELGLLQGDMVIDTIRAGISGVYLYKKSSGLAYQSMLLVLLNKFY